MAKPVSHGLGMGRGSIIDLGDGSIEYRATGKILPAFKVQIADITGFAVRRATPQDRRNGASSLQQVFVIMGGGTELAACPVNYGTSEKLEEWIKAQPSFNPTASRYAPAPPAAPAASAGGLSEELAKLASLRDSGVLSSEEFDKAKSKLLS